MHSKNFDKVKKFYDDGVWSESRVRDAVTRGWITEAEFKEITGKDF